MHSVLSGMGTAYLSLDDACMGRLFDLHSIDDDEKLERELHLGIHADEADVLGGSSFLVCHVCNTIHLIIAWKNT